MLLNGFSVLCRFFMRKPPNVMAKKQVQKKLKKTSEKEEGNKYDKIFKENLRELTPALLKVVLKMEGYRLEPLPQIKLQTTIEKEPDFLQIIFDKESPNGRLLHIEFEGQDEKITDWRMEEYAGIEGKVYQKKVEQHLIYLGEGRPKNIKGEIPHKFYTFRFKVHFISELSFKEFLYGETPHEVIFAILADPVGFSVEEVIIFILERLVQLTGKNIAIRKFIKQLIMLSRKRNLQDQTIKKAKIMVGYKDIEDDVVYHIGLEKGIEKGEEIGKEETGILAIRNMAKKGYGFDNIVEILEAKPSYVKKILKQIEKEAEIVAALSQTGDIGKTAELLNVNPILVKVIKDHHKDK